MAVEAVTHKVLTMDGKESGSVELDSNVFDAPARKYMVHDTVRWQRARARAGTHSCLRKGEVSGGGKKPWRQKGTGNARCGSNTSPLWVGGGVTHGPKPRDYDFRLSKRARRQALAVVLSEKRRSGDLKVLDSLTLTSGKTRDVAGVLAKLGLSDVSTLIVLGEGQDQTLKRASRNLKGVIAMAVDGVNVYDLLKVRYVVGSRDAVLKLQERVTRADAE